MLGFSSTSGGDLAGLGHLRQSVADILTTPIGSRVGRRDYGSRLFELVDRPIDDALKVDLFIATVEALGRWEPRIEVRSVHITSVGDASLGRIVLELVGIYRPEGRPIRLDGITVT